MASQFAIFVEGVEEDLLEGIDTRSRRTAAYRAINKAARDARSEAAKRIRDEVNLPASYVSPGQKRLYVSEQARRSSLEAKITARGRATSLARYLTHKPKPGVQGVTVRVSPGKSRTMRRAFAIRLPQGNNAVTDTRYNLALAIRLRPGESLDRKMTARRVASGLYVLYGPSVNQVFRANDGDGVANDMVPDVTDMMRDEFLRLIKLYNG